MAEVRFEKNGQGYFDFEYLLKLTNKQFVNHVQKRMSKFLTNHIKIVDNDHFVVVYIYNATFDIFKFRKEDGKIFSYFLTFTDVKIMSQMEIDHD